jgi:molybdate transport system substrate-binding protein
MLKRYTLLLGVLAALAGCRDGSNRSPARPELRILAAASTRNALEQIGADFTATTGVPVQCESAASSTLARQIEHGAEADLFLSADEEWADYLEKKGLVAKRQTLLTNRLVVVVPADSKLAVKELADVAGADVKRIAIAGEAVPAGRYARNALRKDGAWERVQNRLLEGKDVSAVFLYVARGEADAGFVYATDAAGSNKVRVAYEVPESLTGPIRYPLVTIRRSPANPDAARFADYLSGEAVGIIFRKAGFGLAD